MNVLMICALICSFRTTETVSRDSRMWKMTLLCLRWRRRHPVGCSILSSSQFPFLIPFSNRILRSLLSGNKRDRIKTLTQCAEGSQFAGGLLSPIIWPQVERNTFIRNYAKAYIVLPPGKWIWNCHDRILSAVSIRLQRTQSFSSLETPESRFRTIILTMVPSFCYFFAPIYNSYQWLRCGSN